jgi:Ca-activated chloride channel family protein
VGFSLRSSSNRVVRGLDNKADEDRGDNLRARDANEKKAELAEREVDSFKQRAVGAGSAGAIVARQMAPAEEPPQVSPVVSNDFLKSTIDNVQNARIRAQAYLKRISSTGGQTFQDPAGYWSNTYIPGDPDMRLVRSRLLAWDRSRLGAFNRLEQAAQQVAQKFDAPRSAAMSLFVQADAAGIQGPTRLRVQVGLKGAIRTSGQRPAMNVGLVLDLRRGVQNGQAALLRALVDGLQRARQAGDRFSLTITGPGGGMVVPPEAFRHGPLKVAMDRLFSKSVSAPGPAPGLVSGLGLIKAIEIAANNVRQNERPGAVLGASLVVLVTGNTIARDQKALETLAHKNAIGGVPMSVVALGGRINPANIDRLVAAGQGNRRFLGSVDAAATLIGRELHTASRAVARALRLRIRLSPGVKLINVLGSRKLVQSQAARVRQAENAIDSRLARDLGITADRGKDEEGIQIVIPNFYAGDEHVILLDVVSSKPGPVADVTLRYKDVVLLKNGTVHGQLSLPAGKRNSGPVERTVQKNLLAWELAKWARNYSRSVDVGDINSAAGMISNFKNLIQGLRLEIPGWNADPDLKADEAMLAEYLRVLNTPLARDPVQRRYLADSLRFAAFKKLHSNN